MAIEAEAAQGLMPALCVDVDGTLIRGDLLFESLVLLIKRNPLYLLYLPLWLLRGKAALKSELAARVTLNVAALPYNEDLVEWLQGEHARGRSLWLVTASNERLAASVAAHLGFFDGVLASDERRNLAGAAKAATLVERFGERGFDYCGNETRDLAVWERAHGAIVVQGSRELEQQAAACTTLVRSFPSTTRPLEALIRELRPHQWAKNILVLMPLFAAHKAGDVRADLSALLAVISFSVCASSVYVLNDLLDLEADRAHPRKCKRPFAAGDLSISTGIILAPALLCVGMLVAAYLPPRFWTVMATYYALTLAYSFALKSLVLVDALSLAGLYTLRIIAGAAAVVVPLSFWMLLFSVLLFLSLAFVKRFAELESLRRQQRLRATGRGYGVEDLPVLQSLGAASGYLSVLVLALYVNSPDIQALYRQPKLIWTLCVLVLYWVSRIWLTAQRGQMHDDPVVFALRDRESLLLGLLAVVTIVLAI
jgi:4-hydroxybenzoate polyprenyltransferase/phosphoserine phosphatase